MFASQPNDAKDSRPCGQLDEAVRLGAKDAKVTLEQALEKQKQEKKVEPKP